MGYRFYCGYCEDNFPDFTGLLDHYLAHHSRGAVRALKVPLAAMEKAARWVPTEPSARSAADSPYYAGADSGCEEATRYLGHQSSCLKCPFRNCVLEDVKGFVRAQKHNRNEEMRRLHREGSQPRDIARIFGVSLRTVQRVLYGWKG